MSFLSRFFSTTASSPAMDKAKSLIADNSVVVFSKSWCSFSRRTKQALKSAGADFKVYELDLEDDGVQMQQALEKLTGQDTVPNIFIGQKHIGGNSDLQALGPKNLQQKLKEAGALPSESL